MTDLMHESNCTRANFVTTLIIPHMERLLSVEGTTTDPQVFMIYYDIIKIDLRDVNSNDNLLGNGKTYIYMILHEIIMYVTLLYHVYL